MLRELLVLSLMMLLCSPAFAYATQRKEAPAEDVMAQCTQEAAANAISEAERKRYIQQCVARKSIENALIKPAQ